MGKIFVVVDDKEFDMDIVDYIKRYNSIPMPDEYVQVFIRQYPKIAKTFTNGQKIRLVVEDWSSDPKKNPHMEEWVVGERDADVCYLKRRKTGYVKFIWNPREGIISYPERCTSRSTYQAYLLPEGEQVSYMREQCTLPYAGGLRHWIEEEE